MSTQATVFLPTPLNLHTIRNINSHCCSNKDSSLQSAAMQYITSTGTKLDVVFWSHALSILP